MGIEILLLVIVALLVVLLLYSFFKNSSAINEKERLIRFKDTALDISDRTATRDPEELFQYFLESCLKLVPKARFGMILLFTSDGLLNVKAAVGFNRTATSDFKLKLEESFLYIATSGKMEGTTIINRLEDIMPKHESGDQASSIKSEMSTPLFLDGELVGLLSIDGDKKDIFTKQDTYIMDYMANEIGMVIKHHKLSREIQDLYQFDSQTHLLNRGSFETETGKLLNDPSKDAGHLYFVLINLNNFKGVNDLFGRIYGDEIISNFADILKKRLGKNDICGRYSGDEFVAVIQGDYIHVNFVLEEAKKDFMSIKNPLQPDFLPSFRYGYASFREGLGDLDTFYKLASHRMAEMKEKEKQQ